MEKKNSKSLRMWTCNPNFMDTPQVQKPTFPRLNNFQKYSIIDQQIRIRCHNKLPSNRTPKTFFLHTRQDKNSKCLNTFWHEKNNAISFRKKGNVSIKFLLGRSIWVSLAFRHLFEIHLGCSDVIGNIKLLLICNFEKDNESF